MKIEVSIMTIATRNNGTKTTMGRTTQYDVGDNPSFERVETARAVAEAVDEFVEKHSLGGTRSL